MLIGFWRLASGPDADLVSLEAVGLLLVLATRPLAEHPLPATTTTLLDSPDTVRPCSSVNSGWPDLNGTCGGMFGGCGAVLTGRLRGVARL